MKAYYLRIIIFILISSSCSLGYSQENESAKHHTFFYMYRGDNVFTGGLGTAVMNGDFDDPLFEFYGQVGYKRYVNPYINVNLSYHKFNLAFKDEANNGFMSFDLNVEGTLMPDNQFTPFVFGGFGLNASNYFKQTDLKVQGGFGVEYLVLEGIGLKLFTDYNYVLSDVVDGKEFGSANDVYWRIGFGMNYYFGYTKKDKIPSSAPTIINSFPIIND